LLPPPISSFFPYTTLFRSAHLPHWMHDTGSHTGMSVARLRFSYRAVADGNVPSHGMRLTGRSSPRPPMMGRMTSVTNSGSACSRSEEHTSELQSLAYLVCR